MEVMTKGSNLRIIRMRLFRRIYKNRRDIDAVYRDCVLGLGGALGPIVGDLCACP
jgi:hypothetical protein